MYHVRRLSYPYRISASRDQGSTRTNTTLEALEALNLAVSFLITRHTKSLLGLIVLPLH